MKVAAKKRSLWLMAALTLLLIVFIGTQTAHASYYCYLKTPANNKTVTAGTKTKVSFYTGSVRKYTKYDAYGNVESTTYQKMPATLKVFKGSTVLYSKDFTYTKAKTITTYYTPAATGTLKIKIYSRNVSLNDDNLYLQDTRTIKVKKPKASAVKNIKPSISVTRAAKKKAVITASGNYGYSLKIYRSTSKSGSYKLIATTSKLTYTDTSIAANKVYYYKARVYAKSGNKSYNSKYSAVEKADKSQDTSALKVTVTSTSSGVKIKWNKYNKAGYYLVDRGTSNNGEGDVIACTGEDELVWLDKDVTKGKTYYYRVTAWYGDDSKPLVKSSVVKIKY